MDSAHKGRLRKLSVKSEHEACKEEDNKCNQKPTLRVRSVTALNDKNKQNNTANKRRGHLLKKALKTSIKTSPVHSDEPQPVIDVFESLVNRKLTYAQNEIKTEANRCEDCDLETVHTPARFGKVYPSPNEKYNTSAGKNNNPLKYSTTPHENIDCSDIDISLPVSKDKITTIECNLYQADQTDDHFEPVSHVPSIFGKVYVKKPPSDMNFLKKSNQEPIFVKSVDKCTAGKRKRGD